MQPKKVTIGFTAAVCILFVASCSVTNLDSAWKDPDYQGGKLKNVLVVGGSTNQIVRRIFEDEFTAKLKTNGTNAIQSYTIFPSEKDLNKNSIEAKSHDLDIDAFIISRVVNTKTEKNYNPAPDFYYRNSYFYDWPNRYSRIYPGNAGYRYNEDRLYYSEYEVVSIETSIYDTQNGKLIWSALSDTVLGGSSELEISSLIEVVMKSLSENHLIN